MPALLVLVLTILGRPLLAACAARRQLALRAAARVRSTRSASPRIGATRTGPTRSGLSRPRSAWASLVLACVGTALGVGFVACSSDNKASGGASAACAGVAAAGLEEVFASHLQASATTGCTGAACHGGGAGGLTFKTSEQFWLATVGVPARSHPKLMLVAPGDPDRSEVYQRLSASASVRMPLGGPYLDDAALAAVRGWICAGAPRPSASPDASADSATPDGGAGGSRDGGGTEAGVAAPVITGVSPGSAPSGSTVTITGSGFSTTAADNVVTINGVAATVLSASATSLQIAVPATATSGALTVTVAGQSTTWTSDFVVTDPVLTSLSPSFVVVGAASATVHALGSGFVQGGVVEWDGAALPTNFVSATELDVTLDAALLAASGSVQVTVKNPDGGVSQALPFEVRNPAPTLTSITPSSVATNGAAFALTVTGTGFVPSSKVHLGGTELGTSYVDATTLTAQVPTLTSAGSSTITVVNPAPGGGTSNGVTLTASVVIGPTITGLSPLTTGSGTAFTVTVSGSGYDCSTSTPSSVTLGATALGVTSCSTTSLTVDVGALAAGTYSVTVTNPSASSNPGTSNVFTLSVVDPNPAPTLTSLSPSSAVAGSAGFTLTVTGTGFVSGSVIQWGGAAKTTSYASSTQLSAVLASSDIAAAGIVQVTVFTPAPGGGTSNALSFSVNNPVPVITSLSPSTVNVGAAAFSLTINGSKFLSTSTVTVGGASRTVHYVSATQLTVDVLASDVASSGSVAVVVTNPGPGGGPSNSSPLTVTAPPPSLASLSPCGTVAGSGAFTLTVAGSSFVSGATVTFNGSALTTSFVSSTQLTASVPSTLIATAPASRSVDVTVTNPAPGGGTSAPLGFGLAAKTATLAANVQPIFTANCATAGCHVSGAIGAPMSLESGSAYGNLVGVTSTYCAPTLRVLACGPARSQSVLVDKVSATATSPPCAGTRMPKALALSATNIATIVDWVAQGAPP